MSYLNSRSQSSLLYKDVENPYINKASSQYLADTSINNINDLFSFIRMFPCKIDYNYLFSQPNVALAIFRALSDCEKTVVLRLMYIPEPVKWDPFMIWFNCDRKVTLNTLNSLRSLHVLKMKNHKESGNDSVSFNNSIPAKSQMEKGLSSSDHLNEVDKNPHVSHDAASGHHTLYYLNQIFRNTLIEALREPYKYASDISGKPPKHLPTFDDLHYHATHQWKNILLWLLEQSSELMRTPMIKRIITLSNDPPPRAPPSSDLIFILQQLNLIHHEILIGKNDKINTEKHLFKWMLKDFRSQLICICLHYLDAIHYGIIVCKETNIHNNNNNESTSNTNSITKNIESNTITASEVRVKQITEVFGFFLALSELLIGQPCSVNILTPAQRRFLHLAYSVGLVWVHNPTGSKHFFPTQMVKLLQKDSLYLYQIVSALSNISLQKDIPQSHLNSFISSLIPSYYYHPLYRDRFNTERQMNYPPWQGTQTKQLANYFGNYGVIIESNFKVFSYISSSILPIIIAQLCDINIITPSILIGVLSRDKIIKAYKNGVTPNQLIQFLKSNAHPTIYSKHLEGKSLIPENILTQLQIWDTGRRRIQMYKASVFEFSTDSDVDVFPFCVNRAKVGWLLLNSNIPSNINVNSQEFQLWKTQTKEKMKYRPQQTDIIKCNYPILVVQSQHKEDMTKYIRQVIKEHSHLVLKK